MVTHLSSTSPKDALGEHMKVLMLDFDGCLNTFPHEGTGLGLERVPCVNLEYLLKKLPELKIVISSSWRIQGLEYCREALKEQGIDPRRVIDVTGDERLDGKSHRGNQIERWLERNPEVTKFAILDDSRDMEPFMDNLVRTNPMRGLTEADVEKALKILG
jgi:Swiss Army Knife RNA repair-like protein